MTRIRSLNVEHEHQFNQYVVIISAGFSGCMSIACRNNIIIIIIAISYKRTNTRHWWHKTYKIKQNLSNMWHHSDIWIKSFKNFFISLHCTTHHPLMIWICFWKQRVLKINAKFLVPLILPYHRQNVRH